MNNGYTLVYVTMWYVMSVAFGTVAVCGVSLVVGDTPVDMILCLLTGHWTLPFVLYAVGKGWIGKKCNFVL